MRRRARYLTPFVLLALASCHKEATTSTPTENGCFGARCVEQAEAAMYYHDYDAAREPLMAVCEKKDGFQCYRLAELYHHGRGGPVELDKAAATYELACTYEHGEGCERRAELARDGNGGPAVELEYTIKGCDLRRPAACTRAAEQYKTGRGIDADSVKAIEYYELACGLGELDGCTGAGDLLAASNKYDGKSRALSAYIRACTGHSPYGCLKVGIAFHEGIGTKPDLEKAQMHFTKACEWGEQDGCHIVEQLKAAEGKPVDLELTTAAAELTHHGGLQVRELSCRMSEHGPTALDAVLSSVARFKDKLDKCAKTGAAVGVTWEFDGGKVREAKADRFAKKGGACVAATLRKARMPATGTCTGVLLVGDPEAAAQAVTVRAEKVQKARDRNTIHVGSEEEEE